MITPHEWMETILPKLKSLYGARLLFLGLQGSYRRGEATGKSDIDLVVLLDNVSLDDLDAYRRIVHAMPEGHKACGFICGVQEFFCWPRHELFPFKMDTKGYYGNLEAFLPPISKADIANGAHIGASALIHMLRHTYLYADQAERPAILHEACKAAFFVMQIATYCQTGVYHSSKKTLLNSVQGAEKTILLAGHNVATWLLTHTEQELYSTLIQWSCHILQTAHQ